MEDDDLSLAQQNSKQPQAATYAYESKSGDIVKVILVIVLRV